MPDEISPIDGAPWPQGDYYDESTTWAPSGVIDQLQTAYGNGGLGLSFSVAGSVITATLALGRARVRGMRYRRSGTPWTQTIALNSTGNPRRDRIVLRRDLAAKTCIPVWVQGTPAANPTAAALVQVEAGVWDVPLYSFTVPASSSTSITAISDERMFLDPAGNGLLLPYVSGNLLRTDNGTTINAAGRTDLKTVVTSSVGPWTTYNGANGVGVACSLPFVYSVNGLMTSSINAARMEQLEIEGTLAAVLGIGGGNTAAANGQNFGGAGGVIEIPCPTGIQVYFRHYNSGGVAGAIGTTNRFSVTAVRPL